MLVAPPCRNTTWLTLVVGAMPYLGLQYLSSADCIITLNDGVVAESGTFRELIDNPGGELAQILSQHSSILAENNLASGQVRQLCNLP